MNTWEPTTTDTNDIVLSMNTKPGVAPVRSRFHYAIKIDNVEAAESVYNYCHANKLVVTDKSQFGVYPKYIVIPKRESNQIEKGDLLRVYNTTPFDIIAPAYTHSFGWVPAGAKAEPVRQLYDINKTLKDPVEYVKIPKAQWDKVVALLGALDECI